MSFEMGGTPWVRQNVDQICCPFCGGSKVLVSMSDVSDDDLRVELYCDNTFCDVREFNILAKRTEGQVQRADAQALREIDEGTAAERMPNDINIMDPKVRAQMAVHRMSRLERRRRKVKIEVTPL